MIISTLGVIATKIINIFKSVAPESNPADTNTIEGVTAASMAQIQYGDQYIKQRLEEDLYTLTAKGKALDKKGSDRINPIERLQPSQSVGYIILQGTLSTLIPSTTTFSFNGITYTTPGGKIQEYGNLPISNSYYLAGENKVYIVTNNEHGLASGMKITISGFVPSEYNITDKVITCIDNRTFTYTPDAIPSLTPPSTIGVYSHISAILYVTSQEQGTVANVTGGAILTLNQDISGVDSNAFTTFSGILGGSNLESDEDYRSRLLDAQQGYLGLFSNDDIITRAKQIRGVTKVKVLEVTPQVGKCTILFIRGNDVNPIPSAAQVTQMKSHLLTSRKQPVIPEGNIIVQAPSPVYFTAEISNLLPNTPAMQAAVKSVIANFVSKLDIGGGIVLTKLRNKLDAVEDASGNSIQDYDLDSPSADVNITQTQVIVCSSDIAIFS